MVEVMVAVMGGRSNDCNGGDGGAGNGGDSRDGDVDSD